MTISTTSNTTVAQGNGLTTSFSFPFPVPAASELFVYYTDLTGIVTELSPAQYSVTGAGSDNGGTVTYPIVGIPIASGTSLTIQRIVPYVQLTDLVNQSGYYPNVVEAALDYLTMALQQIAESAQLSIQVPFSATPADLILPGPAARADQLVGFDNAGNAVTYPVSASVGAGNLIAEGPFVTGVNFTPNVTTTLTLSQAYGTATNVQVHFDTEYQGTDQYTLNGNQIIFSSAIPVGVNKVYIVGGTTLSVGVTANRSIGDPQLVWGGILTRSVDNLSALRALSSSVYTRVRTSGYAAPGDNGNADYWLDLSAAGFTLATPTSVGLTPSTTGGFLVAGTYGYRVTAIDESGETLASATKSTTTTGTTSTVTIVWGAVTGAAGYKIYGRTPGSEQLIMQLDSAYTSWTDDGGITGLGFVPGSGWQWDNGGSRIQTTDGGRFRMVVDSSRYIVEQFGAKADGVTDNAAAINAAINAAWCNGGGVVVFRAGVYVSSQIFMQTNVSLLGIGTDHSGHFQPAALSDALGTTLRLKAGVNPGNGFIYVPLYVHSLRITSINIDGNGPNNPSADSCIYIAPGFPGGDFTNQTEDLYLTIQDCGIYNSSGTGLYAGAAGRGGRVYNSYIFNNNGSGIQIQTSDWTITSCLFGLNNINLTFLGAEACHVTGCDIFTPSEIGGAGGVNVLINDSTFFGGPVTCNGIWFTSCEFDYAAQNGVEVFGTAPTDILFQGCRWNSSSINHNNTYSHLAIGPTVADGGVTLTNCAFRVGAPPNYAQYDIVFASPGAQNVYASNNVHNSGSNVSGISNSSVNVRLYASNATQSYLDYTGRLSALMAGSTLNHQLINTTATENTNIINIGGGSNSSVIAATVNLGGYSANAAALYVGKNSSTSRSINAGGTINASGADYAEYERKRNDCGEIAKGQIVGFDASGKLTDKFALSIRFGIKSTDPSLVGGDIWNEAERQMVDRIAYCGKVPVNVTGAEAGQYIVPVADASGSISAIPIHSDVITPEQYMAAVGRVSRVREDGRAEVVVKVS